MNMEVKEGLEWLNEKSNIKLIRNENFVISTALFPVPATDLSSKTITVFPFLPDFPCGDVSYLIFLAEIFTGPPAATAIILKVCVASAHECPVLLP